MISENDVLKFWFEELKPQDWYKKDSNLDKKIRQKFEPTYWQATRGELYPWRLTLRGRLAEILVLDQFSRNMFRNDSQAFRFDSLAVILSQEASQDKNFSSLSSAEQSFILMPLMHSESSFIHELAIKEFSRPGLENNLEFEYKHKAIIDRFDRYPHRNKILGRDSTPEEIEFLKEPNSSF